jgi:uncharacterized membrane protein (UPF0127 family)
VRDDLSRLLVDGRDVAALRRATSYLARLRGLLFTRGIDGGLLLTPGNSVHGVGMTYGLDVALLDADLVVLHTLRLRPFGLTRARRGVRHVLEAEAGAFARWGLHPGSRIEVAMRS